MRRYLWSTIDASRRLVPYVILECSEEIAEEIESRDRYENKWMFIAERLHERYPEQFPEWWDGYGRRHVFWYNNVLEDYEEAYERMVEERMKELRDSFDDEECLKHEAEWQVAEELVRLPVFVIGDSSRPIHPTEDNQGESCVDDKEKFHWFYWVVYDPDRYPERLYELPSPKLLKVEELEDGRIIEVYQLSDRKGLIRDTYDNGNSAFCVIGVSSEWHDEYIFCLRVCDNDMFEFIDL